MKKIVSTILLCVLLCGSIFSLASCSNIVFGEYSASIDLGLASSDVVVKFGLGTVTIESTTDTIITNAATSTYEAKYKIAEDEEGNRTITFTYAEGADEFAAFPGGEALSLVESEVEGVKYLTIGLYKLKKVK